MQENRCCFCVSLGIAMIIGFFFLLLELVFVITFAKIATRELELWVGIFVILIIDKIGPLITHVNVAFDKEQTFPRKVNFYIFLVSQIIEAIIYATVIIFKSLWTDHADLLKIFLSAYAGLMLFKIIFIHNAYKYWKRWESY